MIFRENFRQAGQSRGICKMDDQNNLTEVVETKNIVKTADGAEADGVIVEDRKSTRLNSSH